MFEGLNLWLSHVQSSYFTVNLMNHYPFLTKFPEHENNDVNSFYIVSFFKAVLESLWCYSDLCYAQVLVLFSVNVLRIKGF